MSCSGGESGNATPNARDGAHTELRGNAAPVRFDGVLAACRQYGLTVLLRAIKKSARLFSRNTANGDPCPL